MAHRPARLTVFRRQVLVDRVELGGWPAAEVARQFQVSRSTAYKWLRRFRGTARRVSRTGAPRRGARRRPWRFPTSRRSSTPGRSAAWDPTGSGR